MRLGESQALKSCLNIGKPSVLGVFYLPHSFLLPSLRHLAFCCWRLICMDNINRAATTSGFLSAISQWEPCLARDKRKKKSEVRIFIFLAPSVQGCFRQTFHSVESYSSYQVSLREFGHTYKHRKPPSQTKSRQKIPDAPFAFRHSFLASGNHCSVFWYYGLVCIL